MVGGLTPTQILLKLGQINICDLGASENKWEFLRIMMLPTWEGGYGYDAIALQETRLVNGGDWKCKLEKHCPWATLVIEDCVLGPNGRPAGGVGHIILTKHIENVTIEVGQLGQQATGMHGTETFGASIKIKCLSGEIT